MLMNNITFRRDGWRGIVGEEFDEENVIRVAEAFARYIQAKRQENPTVAVGFDGRKDSNHFAELFAQILSANNINILLSPAIISTPVLSHAVKNNNCTAGIMITASHNPSNYNGVKFKASYGGPFLSEETLKVQQFLSNEVKGKRNSDRIQKKNFLSEYVEHLKTIIDFELLKKFAQKPFNNASVLIDSMGGAGQTILEDILTPLEWRAQTTFGAAEPNFYDRLPEPIEKNLAPLMYNTSVTDALLGIATDGDADRCGIVYDDGKWMNAHETILALLWHLHTNKKWKGAVIKSASVSDKVRMLAQGWEEEVYDVNVGSNYVTEMMLSKDYLLGAEESGGFGFKCHLPERDGILSGLMFCEMIAASGRSLHSIMGEVREVVGELHCDSIGIPFDKPGREKIIERLAKLRISELISRFPIQAIRMFKEGEALSGVKFILGNSRWLFIRASQTEPMIRIYAEGQVEEELNELLEEGKKLLAN